MLKITKMLAVLSVVLAVSMPASAQWTVSSDKFMPDDPVSGDRLGASTVGISGNVGLAVASSFNGGEGKAYLFDVTTGAQLHRLAPSTPLVAGSYGGGSSIDGNLAVIGDRVNNRVFLYNVTSGVEIGVLDYPGIEANPGFGAVSAVSGNTLVIGAEWDKELYVFDVTNPGSPVQLGAAPIHRSDGGFSIDHSVALSGKTLIAGTNSTYGWKGAAWLYDLSSLGAGTGVAGEVELDPDCTRVDDEQLMLGTSVDIEGDILSLPTIYISNGF